MKNLNKYSDCSSSEEEDDVEINYFQSRNMNAYRSA